MLYFIGINIIIGGRKNMKDYYFVSYMRRNGKSVDEFYNTFKEANSRKNSLINEFGYSNIEVKVTCQFMKVA
jgi:hypothetical protein